MNFLTEFYSRLKGPLHEYLTQTQGAHDPSKTVVYVLAPEYELSKMTYESLLAIDQTPSSIDSTEYRNDSPTTDSQTWVTSKTTTDSFTYGFEEGIELGVTASFDVKIPFVGGGGVELSTNLSFKANQETTKTDERTWSVSTTINMPPYTLTKATLLLYEDMFNTRYHAHVTIIGGTLAVQNQPAGIDIVMLKDRWLPLMSHDERTVVTSGTFKAARGSHTRVDKVSKPLESARTIAQVIKLLQETGQDQRARHLDR